jgi:hypothetical protein
MASVGTTGSGNEKGLGAAYLAVEIEGDEYNAGFFRDDADLAIVVLSDENDYTPANVITTGEFSAWLAQVREPPLTAALHAIVNPPPGSLAEQPGTRYIEVAQATGGELVDIGAEDWQPVFDRLAQPSGPNGMALASPAVEGTVEAWHVPADPLQEQALLPSTYDPVEGLVSVEIADGLPVDEIEILYRVAP